MLYQDADLILEFDQLVTEINQFAKENPAFSHLATRLSEAWGDFKLSVDYATLNLRMVLIKLECVLKLTDLPEYIALAFQLKYTYFLLVGDNNALEELLKTQFKEVLVFESGKVDQQV